MTTWLYDAEGRVTQKKDANNNTMFTFGYYPTGWVSNRVDGLGRQTKYLYDEVGNLTNVDYPNSQDLTFAYDALNRVTNMVDAAGTTLYSYYPGGQLQSENGPWASDTVGYTYQDRLRSTLTLQQPNASDWAQSYGYDYTRRLSSLTSTAGTFSYSYAGAGNLLTNLALPSGAAITNAFDAVGRMLSTRLRTSGGSILNEHVYTYNAASERTRHTRKDGSYVDYSYDALGQLRAALGKESGGVTNRLHEQLGYLYDAAGNLSVISRVKTAHFSRVQNHPPPETLIS